MPSTIITHTELSPAVLEVFECAVGYNKLSSRIYDLGDAFAVVDGELEGVMEYIIDVVLEEFLKYISEHKNDVL